VISDSRYQLLRNPGAATIGMQQSIEGTQDQPSAEK
jgi:hypothetical protein